MRRAAPLGVVAGLVAIAGRGRDGALRRLAGGARPASTPPPPPRRRRPATRWTSAPRRPRSAVRLADPRDSVRIHFKHPPRAGLLFDLDTGRVLWRRRPTRTLPIASLTKMMTALVATDRIREGGKVPITAKALRYRGSGVGLLPKGKRIGISTMLHGLLLPSGNDAARAIAERAGGTIRQFVAMMNARAAAMGLTCSRFSSPDGYEDRGNHSCAADLAAIGRAVLREPRLARVVARESVILPFPIKGRRLYLYNHNPLLRMGYRGTTGHQDRLHRRRRALPRGDRAPRRGQGRRRAAALTRPGHAGAPAARPRLRRRAGRAVTRPPAPARAAGSRPRRGVAAHAPVRSHAAGAARAPRRRRGPTTPRGSGLALVLGGDDPAPATRPPLLLVAIAAPAWRGRGGPADAAQALERFDADGLWVRTDPLGEATRPDGTPDFAGVEDGLAAPAGGSPRARSSAGPVEDFERRRRARARRASRPSRCTRARSPTRAPPRPAYR